MKSNYNTYGLLGQQADGEYNNFLCFGKKCKQRKKERHEARMAKKNAKTDARKADTERVRAETTVIQQVATPPNPPPVSPVITMPLTRQQVTAPITTSFAETAEEENVESGLSNNVIIGVVGVTGILLVGAYLFQRSKKNQLVSKPQKVTIAA